jgi:hypothetical protein
MPAAGGPYTDRVEAFFVIVMAGVLLGVGVWALVAMRHLLTLTHRRPGDD